MARSRSGFYDTIEYIGPRPEKPKRKNFFGGWVIIVISLGMAFWFGRPLIPFLQGMGASSEQADFLIASLQNSKDFGSRLASTALAHSNQQITYDHTYYRIDYPNGDLPASRGKAEDVVIRCYRAFGIDLQVLVHEDMAENFRLYPQLWGASGPDTSIDHRRVANLQRFFERKGQSLPATREAADYQPGDIVVWSLANAESHIGIIVPGPGARSNEPWVVHNMGAGVKWENILFEHSIQRHFRYPASEAQE
jgi:uncharacterized protein YijF (DUF1287 family)